MIDSLVTFLKISYFLSILIFMHAVFRARISVMENCRFLSKTG